MELILIRHAKAFERDAAAWPDDSRRPLTEDGRDQFARFAKRLRHVASEVELVESSGFVRAWQTAMLLEEHARWPKAARLERLEIHADTESPDPVVRRQAERVQEESLMRTLAALAAVPVVAWVGHEPMLSRLASLLLTGSSGGMAIDFRKGAALSLQVDIDTDAVAPRTASNGASGGTVLRAQIKWFLTPGVVRRLAK
ncbi:MAG: histidine phosphatase family protein [Planctomycetaceae bacterium]|nr:histidine phosphatase family protein [Planctomycetaceae bacterium]